MCLLRGLLGDQVSVREQPFLDGFSIDVHEKPWRFICDEGLDGNGASVYSNGYPTVVIESISVCLRISNPFPLGLSIGNCLHRAILAVLSPKPLDRCPWKPSAECGFGTLLSSALHATVRRLPSRPEMQLDDTDTDIRRGKSLVPGP